MNTIPQGKYNLLDRLGAQLSEVHSMSQLCTTSLKLHLDNRSKCVFGHELGMKQF